MILVFLVKLNAGFKLDLVTAGKFCFHFSQVHGSVVDYINVNPNVCMMVNYALHDTQNVCFNKSTHHP